MHESVPNNKTTTSFVLGSCRGRGGRVIVVMFVISSIVKGIAKIGQNSLFHLKSRIEGKNEGTCL